MHDYTKLDIWVEAFSGDVHRIEKDRLSVALSTVRKNAAGMAQKIAHDFPNLTVHDVTHMDALWNVSNLLIDKKHGLNPLEIFILGCTFYLHDAALCFDAYAGGKNAVRETDTWKDAFWRSEQRTNGIEESQKIADFEAIRALHAQQAEKIAYKGWLRAYGEKEIFIIEDEELREHHGALIGKISASHHWDIHRVASELQDVQNPVSSLPSSWTIRPILLACLLRCADAAQIDGTRAPEQLIRHLQSTGVSRDHWTGQNRIGAVTKVNGTTKLLITTTKPFKKEDASAWWVIYDTIQTIEKEIKNSNSLITRKYTAELALLVDGVESNYGPEELSTRIQTEGWQPTGATIKVGDVERVVGALGGQQLYGSDDILAVVIRELLQNSLDAVSARRAIDPGFDVGTEILVNLFRNPVNNKWVLRLSDMGVGMSHNVLLNSLLDFGSSFWSSQKASDEFPGLQSKSPQIIGRFGIGFFSVFSVAESVTVYSRRFDAGHVDFRCLEFPNGLSLRPIISRTEPASELRKFSTIVEVELASEYCNKDGEFEVKVNQQGLKNFEVSFPKFVSSMVCDVRAKIKIGVNGGESVDLLPSGFGHGEAKEKLNQLCFGSPSEQAMKHIEDYSSRMRVLRDKNKVYGFAALTAHSTEGMHFISSRTIDGLSTPHSRATDNFIGWMEHECRSAKRDTGNLCVPKQVMDDWLEDQAAIFKKTGPDDFKRYIAAANFAQLGGDPNFVIGSLVAYFGGQQNLTFINFDAIADLAKQVNFIIPVSAHGNWIDRYCKIPIGGSDIILFPYVSGGVFADVEVSNGQPVNCRSLAGIITSVLSNMGYGSKWSRLPAYFESALGHADALKLEVIM